MTSNKLQQKSYNGEMWLPQVPTAPDSSSKMSKKRMLSQWLPSSKEGKWIPCHPRDIEIAQM